jgi:hypothetical protein
LTVAVIGIAGVTRNGGAFTNTGQFTLSGNSIVVNSALIPEPAVGVTDTYVVTINNLGGGTTLVTVVVTRGSVRIESITITKGDATPGYVVQGGLMWMPITLMTPYNYFSATALCAGTIAGLTGWRLPTQPELSALSASGALNGQGWRLFFTWSSTPGIGAMHALVDLSDGSLTWASDPMPGSYATCVRSQ